MVTAAIALLAFATVGPLQAERPKSVRDAVLSRPTGNNGYEEYLLAGDIATTDEYRAYELWLFARHLTPAPGDRPIFRRNAATGCARVPAPSSSA